MNSTKALPLLIASLLPLTTEAGEVYVDMAVMSRMPNTVAYEAGLWNPLGVLRFRYHPRSAPWFGLFIEHLSSIPNEEDDGGLNSGGVMITVRLD